MSYKNLFFSLASAIALAACSSGSELPGSYVASDNGAAFMVQIASVEKGQLKGTLSAVVVDENGKTSAVTRPLSGTAEGDALNLTVESGNGLSVVTGAVEDDGLRLTFFSKGSSSQLKFTKSDASRFGELANATRRTAAEKVQEVENAAATKDRIEQRAKTQKSIDSLADDVFAKARQVQDMSQKFNVVIKAYEAARNDSSKMMKVKSSTNSASPEGQYKISQFEYEISQISNDMNSTHDQVISYTKSLDAFRSDAEAKSFQFFAECQSDTLLNCSRLSAGLNSLQDGYRQYQVGYARENAAFKRGR